jgi:hypothetical protein
MRSRRGLTPSEEMKELHRRLEWAPPDVPFETILENLKAELGLQGDLAAAYNRHRGRVAA